ncbi:MAG: CBS domain-containing protein [Rhodospirillaceae bacterium]|nr:CBS domain-containing protein [Rhodospirillales bacterium]
MQVQQCMSKDVKLINPDMTLREAAGLMREQDTGFLPVGENDRLVGTLTDRDITVRAVCEGKDPNTAKVRDAMSEHIVYCFDDQDTTEAADLMAQKQIRRLAVLNHDKRLVGIVSLGDLAGKGQDENAAEHALEGVSKPTRH